MRADDLIIGETREPESRIVGRCVGAGVRLAERLAGLVLGALAIVVLLQVFSRYVLYAPIDWTIDGATILLVWVSFLGAATASFGRQHFALEFVADALPPRLSRAVGIVANILVVVVLIELVWLGYAFASQQMDQVYPGADLPKGWAAYAIPLSAALMLPRYLVDALIGAGLLLPLPKGPPWEH